MHAKTVAVCVCLRRTLDAAGETRHHMLLCRNHAQTCVLSVNRTLHHWAITKRSFLQDKTDITNMYPVIVLAFECAMKATNLLAF